MCKQFGRIFILIIIILGNKHAAIARKLSNVAVPAIVIPQKTIQQSGALRLNAILQEQTGLNMTSNFGAGLQIQGLNPDYILILLDGQPLIGRNAGVLDLSRITVNNIKKIEIVKGPSSSLYGSEAMGGVVNIITRQAEQNSLSANFRYGSYATTDANISGSYRYKKFSSSAFVNRNSSNGYDFNKKDTGKTVMPYNSYTTQVQLKQELGKAIQSGITLRYYYERQNDLYSTGTDIAKGTPDIKEYNILPSLQWQAGNSVQTVLRGYLSQFQTDTRDYTQNHDSLYYDDFFQQRFYRVENQTNVKISNSNDAVAGAGYTWERLNTNRYSGIRTNTIGYVYLQDEQRVGEKASIIGGLRYDHNAAYASRLSPKLAARFRLNERWNLTASYGAGFKAPDYRQLYLNFTNNAAGGYTVYGANETSVQQLEQQKQAGILSSITPFGYQLKLLNPEYSSGINVGALYHFKKILLRVNAFRNDIDNLIVTQIIAYKPSNAPVYSYFNVNSALTEGAEMEIKYSWNEHFRIESGYQFLITADKEVLKQIKEGKIFGREPGSLTSVQLHGSDYGGLTDRSKHMANLKLFYENNSWFATMRFFYRSRWGVRDMDGNLILNRSDEYANGYAEVNASAGHSFCNGFSLQAGIDNVTNYRNKQYLPGDPGFRYYLNLSYQFIHNKK